MPSDNFTMSENSGSFGMQQRQDRFDAIGDLIVGPPGPPGPPGEDAPDDYILVQTTQPASETNAIWVDPSDETEVELPTWEEFDDLKSAFDDLGITHFVSPNLVDYTQNYNGRPNNTAGADINDWLSGGKSYATTMPFEIVIDTSYTIANVIGISTYFRLYLYDATKKFISASDTRTSSTGTVWAFKENVNNAKYARIVINAENLDQPLMVCKTSEYANQYIPYGYEYRSVEDLKLSDGTVTKANLASGVLPSDKLASKNLWIFGDSIAAGDGNNNVAYGEMLAGKYGMVLSKYANSGATLCKTFKPTNNILDQVTDAIANATDDPDIILVEGYTNDISQEDYETYKGSMVAVDQTGAYTNLIPTDGSTMCASLEYIYKLLRASYPSAFIAFITVHKMSSRNISKIYDACSLCRQISEKWCIPVIDVMAEGQLNTKIASMKQYTYESGGDYDNTHPNEAGYKLFYVPLIENQLMKMVASS